MVTIINHETGEPVGYIESDDFSTNVPELQRFFESAYDNGVGREHAEYETDDDEDIKGTDVDILKPEDDGFIRTLVNSLTYPYKPSLSVNKQDEDYSERQYVDDPSEAPDEVEVHQGEEENTWFYYPEETESVDMEELRAEVNSKLADIEDTDELRETAGKIIEENLFSADLVELREILDNYLDTRDMRRAAKKAFHEYTKIDENSSLSIPADFDEQRARRKAFEEKYGRIDKSIVDDATSSWVSADMYSEEAAPLWHVARDETDNDKIYSRADPFKYDISDEEKEAVRNLMDYTQDVIREKFGDKIPLFRGLKLNSDIDIDEEGQIWPKQMRELIEEENKDVILEHSSLESWSTNPIEAEKFAGDGGIILVEWGDTDEILVSGDVSDHFIKRQAEFVRLHEGKKRYSNHENVFPSSEFNELSIAKFGVEMWQSRNNNEDKSMWKQDAVEIPGEMNQANWLRQLNTEEKHKRRSRIKSLYDISKYRVYIDSRDDAPDWADVEEGPQGGIYYEVGDSEGQARLGQPASEAPENVPDHLDLRNVHQWLEWEDVDDSPGADEDSKAIAEMDDGSKVFVTLSGDKDPTRSTEVETNNMTHLVAESIDETKLDPEKAPLVPEMHVNEEVSGVVAESVGAEDSLNYSSYFRQWKRSKREEKREEWNREQLITSLAFKAVVGDPDTSGNIVTSKDKNFYPIDFDLAGRDIEEWDMLNKVNQYRGTNEDEFDIDKEEIGNRMIEIANAVNINELENRLEDSMYGRTEGYSTTRYHHLKNIQYLRDDTDNNNEDNGEGENEGQTDENQTTLDELL